METLRPMTCKEMVELITEHLEGKLSREDHERFEEHLGDCDGCEIYLAQMKETIQVLGKLEETDVEPKAMDKFLTAFRNWKKP